MSQINFAVLERRCFKEELPFFRLQWLAICFCHGLQRLGGVFCAQGAVVVIVDLFKPFRDFLDPAENRKLPGSAKDRAAPDHIVANPADDPLTMMSGIQAEKEASKGKKKKKKMTKAEKTKARLDKAADTLKRSGAGFQDFMIRADKWLAKHSKKLIETFTRFDSGHDGAVTYEEFKSGMLDLNAPFTTTELHLLTRLFDQENLEEVEYVQLTEGLKHIREQEKTYREQDIRPALTITERNFPHCPTCKLAHWDGEPYKEKNPRYIEILFRFLTFEGRQHPGHFSHTVHSHIKVFGLQQIIKQHTDIQTTTLGIFQDKSWSQEAMLDPEMTLEEYGFKGGAIDEPEELLLYYDYKVDFQNCPLLQCDHYFAKYPGHKQHTTPRKQGVS